jgi:D-threo-aldose 1-dehydrogenase
MIDEAEIDPGGVKTTRLGFGTASLHHLPSSRKRQELLAKAHDLGIRHFDTAPAYGHGLAERELGLFLRGRRDECIVVTKYGLPEAPWIEHAGPIARELIALRAVGARFGAFRSARPPLTPDGLRKAIEASLRRLRIDFIDVHLLHDPELSRIPSLPDLLGAYQRIRDEGKIRAFGVAGSFAPCQAILDLTGTPMVLQAPEREWNAGRIPSITFGAISSGAQRFGSPRLNSTDAVIALKTALARRPRGVVLFATRRPENLATLARACSDAGSALSA